MQNNVEQALKVLTEALAPQPTATKPPQEEGLISSGKLALTMGVSHKTVANWRAAGCPCTPLNGRGAVRGYRYSLAEVRSWLSSRGAR